MAGIIKLSGPSKIRKIRDDRRPIMAFMCFLSVSHCSRKITTKMAVNTKSMPSRLNVISEPSIPPRVDPAIQ